MNKHLTMLTAILLLQLLIAAALFSNTSDNTREVLTKKLLVVNPDTLNEIKITAPATELVLVKGATGWQLKNHPELPLMQTKIAALTTDLANVSVTWPISSTESSHDRFKVTDKHYEKQLVFKDSKGTTQSLLLGHSPSYKKLYVRNADSSDVYSIEFSGYQVNTEVNDWLDKSLLSLDSLTKISHSNLSLQKDNDGWQFSAPKPLADQQALDQASVESLVNHFKHLTVTKIVDIKPKTMEKLSVTDSHNQQYTYLFAEENDNYLVSRNDYNYWFGLPKSKFEQLAQISLDNFTASKNSNEEENHTASE